MPNVTPSDFLFPSLWDRKLIRLEQAWGLLPNSIKYGDPNIVIAVIDRGIKTDANGVPENIEFQGMAGNTSLSKIYKVQDFTKEKFGSHNEFPVLNNGEPDDHGVNVAGVAAAKADNPSINAKGVAGAAPDVRLMGIILNNVDEQSQQTINFDQSWRYNALEWIAGINLFSKGQNSIAQISPGTDIIITSTTYTHIRKQNESINEDLFEKVISKLATYSRNGFGITFFDAAGNDNIELPTAPTIFDPNDNSVIWERYERIIAIGASSRYNGYSGLGEERRASYSNHGNKIDLCAPSANSFFQNSNFDLLQNKHSPPFKYGVMTPTFTGKGNIPGDALNPFILQTSVNAFTSSYIVSTNAVFVVVFIDNGTQVVVPISDLSANANVNDNSITVSNASEFQAKQWILIQDSTNGDEWLKIKNIVSNTLFLDDNTPVTIQHTASSQVQVKGFISISVPPSNLSSFFIGKKIILSSTVLQEVADAGLVPVSLYKEGVEILHINTNANEIIISDTLSPAIANFGNGHPPSILSATTLKLNTLQGLDTHEFLLIGAPNYDLNTGTDDAQKIEILGLLPNSDEIIIKDLFKPYSQNTNLYLGSGSDYTSEFSGTSSAAPLVAGVASLILSAKPTLNWVEVRQILRDSAVKIDLNTKGFEHPAVPNNDNNNPFSATQDDITRKRGVGRWKNKAGQYIYDFDGITVNTGVTDTTPHFSEWYGFGRINAEAAVNAALQYSFQQRDLKIRDNPTDDGTATNPNTINSPDVWVRVEDPSVDLANAYPGGDSNPNNFNANFGIEGPTQQVYLSQDSHLYARINNKGFSNPTSKESLDTWVRFYIAVTDGNVPPNTSLFKFPDHFKGEDDIIQLYSQGTKVQLIGEKKIDAGTMTGDNGNTPIAVTNITWSNLIKPHPDNTLRTFLLAHIAPFDGGDDASEVENNNNLTYKEIFIPQIRLKDGNGFDNLPKELPVDINGVPGSINFNIDLLRLPLNVNDGIEIQCKIFFKDGSSQTIIFKKVGNSWVFDNAPTNNWIDLSQPNPTGTNPNFQEKVNFQGTFNIDNQVDFIQISVKSVDGNTIIIIERSFEFLLTYNYVIPDSGIASEKKTTLHTFTDFDLLPPQDGTKNFGPVTGVETTEYRTWSAFTGINTGNQLKAYAVTDGQFFIQEIPSTSLVNLILKPDTQPEGNYSPVKFFVYRGLKRSSFLDGNGNPLPDSTGGLSQLMTRMWQVKNANNVKQLQLNPNYTDLTLVRGDFGLEEPTDPNPDDPNTTLIENIFDTNVFQQLTAGMWIGDFDTADYGFEIIVEGPNYSPKLADARLLDHKVLITYPLTNQPQFGNDEEEDISIKLRREQVLSYLDATAYFGLLAHGKIELHKSSGNQTIDDTDTIYNDIITRFDTKNKVYVDIRNELNNSLNFYGSYSDNSLATKVAKIKFDSAPVEYHNNGWPILILDAANDFTPDVNADFIKATFNFPDGDNNLPSIYLMGSSFFADALNYKERFQILSISSGFTDDIELSVANKPAGNSLEVILPFAIKLAYTRRYDTTNLPTSLPPVPAILKRPWKDDLIDNILIFDSINIVPPVLDLNFQTTTKWNTLKELIYCGWTSVNGIDFTLRRGTAKDSIGEICFATRNGPSEENGSASYDTVHSEFSLTNNAKNRLSFFHAISHDFESIRNRILDLVNPNAKTVQVDSVYDNYSGNQMHRSFDDVISLAYTNAEKQTIQTAASSFMQGPNQYLIALNHELRNDNNNIPFYVFDLGIQGVEFSSTTFQHEVKRFNTNIKFYSLDGRIYFTDGYATSFENVSDFNEDVPMRVPPDVDAQKPNQADPPHIIT